MYPEVTGCNRTSDRGIMGPYLRDTLPKVVIYFGPSYGGIRIQGFD